MVCFSCFAQDETVQIKEAVNLERQLKDIDALSKYKEIAAADPKNIMVLVKCAEISSNIGSRQTVIKDKQTNYLDALNYAQQAFDVDSNSADANYAMALVKGKMVELETENKKILELQKEVKGYADKAVMLNPGNSRANYVEGRWHYEMVSLAWYKQAATKFLHRSFPEADIDSAIIYMEKCRSLEQYFAANYLELAKAYKFKNRPAQAIEVLNKLVKLPNRTPNDIAIKAEGQQILSVMQ